METILILDSQIFKDYFVDSYIPQESAEILFTVLDTNGSEKIELEEFLKFGTVSRYCNTRILTSTLLFDYWCYRIYFLFKGCVT